MCLFKTTETVEDYTFFCDLNNMVTTSRCDDDGMGDISIEMENPSIYYDLHIESFYIGAVNMDIATFTNGSNATFVLKPEAVAVVHVNSSSMTISDLVIREGAADGLQDFVMETGIAYSDSAGVTRLDVELLLTDPTDVTYLYQCHHLVPFNDGTDVTYYSCDMDSTGGSTWHRLACPNSTESWTLRTDSLEEIAVESVSSGVAVESFCIPGNWTDALMGS